MAERTVPDITITLKSFTKGITFTGTITASHTKPRQTWDIDETDFDSAINQIESVQKSIPSAPDGTTPSAAFADKPPHNHAAKIA